MSTDLHRPAPSSPSSPPPPPIGAAAGRAARLVLGFVLVAAGVLGALTLWSDALVEVDETRTTHPAVDRLVLDLDAEGTLDVVVTDDTDEIVVEQTTRTWYRDMEVTQTIQGDELRITTGRCDNGWVQFGTRCSASFVVTVPTSTSVAADISHGGLRLAGVEGPAQLGTGFGDIHVSDVAGRLDLRTGHGSITVDGAGDDVVVHTGFGAVALADVRGEATASTGNGDVTLRDIDGPVEATTDHGSIDAVDTRENVTLASGHGDIAFAPATAPSHAELDTGFGEVSVTLPGDARPYAVATDASGGEVDLGVATDPDAEDRLDLRTGHGQISVDYAGG